MSIRVIAVDNSEELLEKITRILKEMDVVMPDISGITLAAKIYQLPDPPEVVLLSGIPGFSLEAWKIRAFGFIIKPYTRGQIVDMLNRYRCEKAAEKVLS